MGSLGTGRAPLVPLAGGGEIPQVGFGTWPMVGDEARRAVRHALDVGYRLIDTSEQYGNEAAVGAAIRESAVPREELFITTKFNAQWHGERLVEQAFRGATRRLGTGYIDLFLIHWPNPWLGRYVDAWRGLVKLRALCGARAIGVSNFLPRHIDELIAATGVVPAVNQIELDPTLPRRELRAYHDLRGITTEAWSPLGRGGELLRHPIVQTLAERHDRSPAQIVLRWHVEQRNVLAVRSSNADRIGQNIDLFDFALGSDELELLEALDQGRAPARDPETHGH
jgi:2,5-diketo-D-gluconate reductase A